MYFGNLGYQWEPCSKFEYFFQFTYKIIETTLEALGSEVHFFKCDVGNKSEIHRCLAETFSRVGNIDILVWYRLFHWCF